jgi:RimJ/RimL family protein N-acetyltransferase
LSLHWKPVVAPRKVVLEGQVVRLEPVDPDRHAHALFSAQVGAPELWDYLPYGPFGSEAEFTEWLRERAATDDPLFYAILDRSSMQARGMASYLRAVPGDGVIEIGHIWFAPELQRTSQATEAMYLMARHVFDDLGYRRFEWKCNELNEPSRRAAARLGFTYEGTFRQHMVVKDRNRDTAWFSMLDGEWPIVRAAFEAWLEPDNFDSKARQKRSLAAIREELARTAT